MHDAHTQPPPDVSRRGPDARLRLCVLGSGSSGNCMAAIGPQGTVLVDAGFSPRETRRRMELCGLDSTAVRAIVLTHPDSDHLNAGWARVVGGLTGPRLLVRVRHAEIVRIMGYERAWIDPYEGPFTVAGIHFDPCTLPHDALGSTAFRISVGADCAGHATDLGRPTPRLIDHLAGVSVLCLESNYDPQMQRASGRPPQLIARVMGGRGHLANHEALETARALHRRAPLSALVLLHLSRQCNAPGLVDRLYALEAPELHCVLTISSQFEPSPILDVAHSPHHATLFDP